MARSAATKPSSTLPCIWIASPSARNDAESALARMECRSLDGAKRNRGLTHRPAPRAHLAFVIPGRAAKLREPGIQRLLRRQDEQLEIPGSPLRGAPE